MEECVEILENYLDYNEQLKKDYSETAAIEEEEIRAIKNLLTRYKEKEEIIKKLDKNMFVFSNTVAKEYIPKSKVKEKIEELETKKKEYGFGSIESIIFLNKIQVLQELLRRR